MDAPTIPVSVDSSERNFRDAIDIGIHEHLQGVPIREDMSTLRFRMGMVEEENASLRGKIRTMEATETVTRSQERRARMERERQLASVLESQRQDRENFRMLQDQKGEDVSLVTLGEPAGKLNVIKVMDAPTIPVYADSSVGNFKDVIDIGVNVVHPVLVAVVAFPAMTIVTTVARHEEAFRGIHELLQEVPIEKDMSTLRFKMGMAEADNASLCGKIRTMKATETFTHSRERRDHMEMERQLASVQESQRQDRENIRKLQELVTSQLGRHP
nr:hypothetical protein [Tanacetum cinerariifolium]